MEIFSGLLKGFSVALTPVNLASCLIGVLVGTMVGVLPGLGPAAAIALLLPVTFGLDTSTALILLAGIYYGAMYGGSTTSILVNIPGEAASVVTCLDGYQMAKQGRAGPALGIAAFGSWIAGTIGTAGLMILAPWLGRAALRFGPPEFVAVLFCAFAILIYLAGGSFLKATLSCALGLFLGVIGIDSISGVPRFTFGSLTLMDGVGLVPLVMGLFGIAEVLENIELSLRREIYSAKISYLLPRLSDWKRSAGPIARGTVLGFFLGILPGGGAVISSFASYALEKRISKHPEEFGKGAIEGVAGPETANNAATSGAFVPLMTLGIPANAVMALMLGALLIHGVQPGPLMLQKHPEVFWGVVASMYIGNVMLLVLNLPLIGVWVQLLKVPYRVLFPLILLFCLVGAYSVNNNLDDVLIMLVFGVGGYLMRKFEYEPAPMVFAFVLSGLFETSFRQSLLMSGGNFLIFFARPISVVFVVAGFCLLLLPLVGRRLPGEVRG
jgi:putative tricarboxylic transport membrane protein